MKAVARSSLVGRRMTILCRPAIQNLRLSPKRYATSGSKTAFTGSEAMKKWSSIYGRLSAEPMQLQGDPKKSATIEQLLTVSEMVDRLRRTNQPQQKQLIIAEYARLRELIEYALGPRTRFHVTKQACYDYNDARIRQAEETGTINHPEDPSITWDKAAGDSLMGILRKLEERSISGNYAYHYITIFLLGHIKQAYSLQQRARAGAGEITPTLSTPNVLLDQDYSESNESESDGDQARVVVRAEEAFWLLVERNLKAGVGLKVLAGVRWPDLQNDTKPAEEIVSSGPFPELPSMSSYNEVNPSKERSTETANSPSTTSAAAPIVTGRDVNDGLKSFSCALGTTIAPHQLKDLQKRASNWYASRKLDGVRVIALLDFHVPHASSEPITFDEARFVSRSGNEFGSLDELESQLVHIQDYPSLRTILDQDPVLVEQQDEGVIKRLVLDGEVCVMVKAGSQPVRISDDGTGASALWENDGLVEDFASAVSMVKRHATMENPMYFLFDTLSWAEVHAQKGLPDQGLGYTFGKRAEITRDLTEWLRERTMMESKEPKVRALVQWPMKPGDVDGMMERAMKEGWEGLVFRADVPYKGTRSADIRKFKKLQDAEYAVVDLETSEQRLPIDGVYAFYEAMKNVWIEHKGHRVAVGSGFTPKERIQFAKDPSLIVGKQITVEYFSESESASRESGTSLRFPRVKAVWNEGKRTI